MIDGQTSIGLYIVMDRQV